MCNMPKILPMKRTLLLAAISATFLGHAVPFSRVHAEETTAITKAMTSVFPALVRIHVVMEEGDDGRMKKQRGSGSGTIISEDGYILTNHHVAGRGTRFLCTLSNREEVDATLVGTDALSDLAIIKLDLTTRRNKDQTLPVAKFGDSSKLKVGDTVFAMGSPGGLSQSVTRGIVANTELIAPRNMGGLTLDGENVGELVRWIGHDAVIYGGNSGGPLVNTDGEIIGVNEVGIASLGGAIPSNLAKAVTKQLIEKGGVDRSWIGVEIQPLLRVMAHEKGALVSTVLKDSPAEKAGVRAGDFITEYNGQPVPDCHAPEDLPLFNAMVLNTPVGGDVKMKGLRNGQPQTWETKTLLRDAPRAKEMELKSWGLTVRNQTRLSALESRRTDTAGVLVDSVRNGGPCAEAKPSIRPGNIITKFNGKPVTDVKSLIALTEEFTKGSTEPKPALISYDQGREQFVTVVKIGPQPEEQKARQPEKAWLGASVQVISPELATAMGISGKKGVRVTSVAPGSAAEKGGIKPSDLLLKLDGQVINASRPEDQEVLSNLIRGYDVGAEVEFEGIRDGAPLKLTSTLGSRPKDDVEIPEFKDERFEFSARDLSENQRTKAELETDVKGVFISSVASNGWAALAGLRDSDILLSIDGEAIPDIATLKKKLTQITTAKPRQTVFFIRRGIRSFYMEVEPQW